MTLLLTEGFEGYRNMVDCAAAGKWNAASSDSSVLATSNVKTGNVCMGGAYNSSVTKNLGTDKHTKIIVGFSLKCGAAENIMYLRGDSGATTHFRLDTTSDGTMKAYNGAGALLASSAAGFHTGASHNYFEVVFVLHDTTGSINIYKNAGSTPGLTYSGDTRNGGTDANIDQVQLRLGFAVTWDMYMDDIYIANGAGATQNDRIGEVRCWPILPTGNGANNGLTGSDGNSVDNYVHVDEGRTVNTADYVGSATPGTKDTYAYGNLTPTSGDVVGVTIISWLGKSDAGALSGRNVVRSGGTDAGTTDIVLSATPVIYAQELRTNPVTAGAWTISDVNAAEFGSEVRT